MQTDRIVAWRVTARGFSDAGIYAAATADRAMVMALKAARAAGYMVAWNDLTVRRAPEFDGWVARQGQERGWDEDYARRCMAQDDAGRAGTASDVPSISPPGGNATTGFSGVPGGSAGGEDR